MPGIRQNGRKRPSTAISEDEDERSEPSSSVSVGSKRARTAPDVFSSPVRTNGSRTTQAPQSNHTSDKTRYVDDEFQPGSLIRVKLKNFVTYTAAEFLLGPSLNMVIGPNGTGKSTLVCAICLGLGWGSEHLGRAKDLGAFVKHGASEAEIEIELAKGPGMDKNPIIQRLIRKEDNKSAFTLNGKRTAQNAVTTMCKTLSIQIDNLCQFLPQDRVVEFAKMTDVDRLRETQRAAAPAYMVAWHDQLKVLRADEKDLETKQQNEKGHLDKLESQQNSTRGDVERWHQREELLQKSTCLEKVRPAIELRLRKEAIKQAKVDIRDARLQLDQLKADVEPVQEAEADVLSYRNQIEQVVTLRKDRVEMCKTQADRLYKDLETQTQHVSDFDDRVKGELRANKDRERDIARINADILRLQKQHDDQPVQYDADTYDTRKAEVRSQLSAAQTSLRDKQETYSAGRLRISELSQENERTKRRRAELDTQSGKQASHLARVSRDTATAWDWFQKNKDTLQLKGEVVGPPLLECSLTHARYAQAVESQLRKGDMVAITCTNGDDQRLLANKFLSKPPNGGLGLHDIHLRSSPNPLSAYRPAVAPENLSRFGFEGYILDYICGPDVVLAMLCENTKLHQIAYASKRISDEQHTAVEADSGIRKWVSGSETYQITVRREYNASSTAVTQFRRAQWFVEQPVNTEEKRALDDKLKKIMQDATELKENLTVLKGEMDELEGTVADLRREKDNIQMEQDRLKRAIAEWAALPTKIERKQSELDAYVQQNAETNSRIRDIKTESRIVHLKIATATLDYAKVVTQLRTFHESLVESEIRLIEAKSEYNALVHENQEILSRLRRKESEIADMEKRYQTMRSDYGRLRGSTQEDINNLTEGERAMALEYLNLPDMAALEHEIQTVKARLEMMSEGNPGAIRAYEKRKDEIVRTKEKLAQHIRNLETTKEQIKEIREKWEPELDALIDKISAAFAYNFEQIGCAGQVGVYKDEEDFDNWSIQISVRFRDGESLAVLNSHRQSGGERAVSTIFYLMALQDLAQSPFRVVDEINQGMDPRNERMVHERMVDIACQERTSQYFLITPKLLPGLKFHEKMKVHVINSGEHVPDARKERDGGGGSTGKDWDFREMARVALRVRKGVIV
ncbi:structural maintenance of chromosomes protein-like protein 5 [Plenodomus tracheiphilus IPT5]|uniref:Structural maintenance of chromosomes protein 5 n=1 Tax=Plenodomus tracheiphilus IPT5 TaxID=1408161 RepID=A0A6A7AZP3_9PLEO|nr:structural maintenance of chromosomes protein-like protein 5 [Plenodomus tracheiphilus IPT5]